jgi:Stress responsive A/B Barrel Domain
MIRHSVILKLKKGISDKEKQAFFDAVNTLEFIPDVQKFEVLKQTSVKNKYEYGISMEFDNQQQYETYSDHVVHQAFIRNYWMNFVVNFLEIDYELM